MLGDWYPRRVVCLTEEPTEMLYLLGEQERIVGISGFTVRPTVARKEKPRVSAFTEADIPAILALRPDLVVGFSDLQAGIAAELIRNGITVWINNHRTVKEIMEAMVRIGYLVGKGPEARSLMEGYAQRIADRKAEVGSWAVKPVVYFEEWPDPMISGICWVSELIEAAGGIDAYAHHRGAAMAKDRVVQDARELVAANPDLILASWCGKKFKKEHMLARPGWEAITAIREDWVKEVKSSLILQPGPAALGDGFEALCRIMDRWKAAHPDSSTSLT